MRVLTSFKIACSTVSPLATRVSTAALNSFNWSATAALRAIMADAQLAEEPTALNSKRLPVKANGDVRLRSVLSIRRSGICGAPDFLSSLPARFTNSFLSLVSNLSRIWLNWFPTNIEMIAGGASFAPRRCPFVAEEIDAFISPLCLYTAAITFTKNVINCKLASGVLPGENNCTPVSVPRLQLLCFPEPFTPLKGFSCSRTRKLCLRATSSINSINSRLWSFARFNSSNIGASSN